MTERIYQSLPKIAPDIEIANETKLLPITKVAQSVGLDLDELELYGPYKAKLSRTVWERLQDQKDGALILVTAMTATPAGEGKTVTSIGLSLALARMGLKQMLVLREPSLGPTFGVKGGAAGGGHAQVLPMDDINMHFTGDLHAVTTAHNLLAATLDNHIYHGNELGIDPEKVVWRRVIDLCDRQLRSCEIGLGGTSNGFAHHSGFDITASSEIMAILALTDGMDDLQKRLGNILVAYTKTDQPVFASQLNVTGAMAVLLRDAIKPNIVQTTENTPALIHCGPFANIAHGCNSLMATRIALKLSDYVVTEAGFAADLGAEKFIGIKCRLSKFKPAVAVLVVTARALKMHGGIPKDQIHLENIDALKNGLENVRTHLENLEKFGIPVVIAVNRFPSDTPAELNCIFEYCHEKKVRAALSETAALGSVGGIELAEAVLETIKTNTSTFHQLYETTWPLKRKIECIATQIYRADGVDYTPEALKAIERIEALGLDIDRPICMAKTQLSISDDPKKLAAPSNWRLTVRDVLVRNGAGFVVAITGKMLLMPGMPKKPAAESIGIENDGRIFGLS